MSEELPRLATSGRPLNEAELKIIRFFLKAPKYQRLLEEISNAIVWDDADGGMGSIQFSSRHPGSRILGESVASATFKDEDGVLVTIELNLDQNGDLMEMDFWKVDFSPLKKYPTPDDLIVN